MQKIDSYLGWKVDFADPPGAPAFCGPDSISWRVFKNPVALGIGGVAAVLLEFADARIRSGVWDHSTYKQDPIGRSQRTGMAAMVGVYGPQAAARRVIQGVTNMHARVQGETPSGEAYKALDVELLDWVSATAGWGFLTAYDRFVAKLTEEEKRRCYAEQAPVARLYGVQTLLHSDADFMAMLERLAPRFEPHPIVGEFLDIFQSSPGAIGLPKSLRRALAQASVSLLPPSVRTRLELGPDYDLSPFAAHALRGLGALAERIPIPSAPPSQACLRLGLPADFLYRSRSAQRRLLAGWTPPRDASAVAAE
ncbi:MAG TPA: oxygenase MpaB family protein [Vitreimonas sp.]|uniref:oxygenase MpaB family protein n=1 Tax=Vitreimonas sp. TaxID=3069702 RepID=UPI002D4E0651|nr:oxygenase MpaB family protein [Vitreimonas sp.]HYD88122.1 oxygenase MpaB family protein [Vitreimonas sp.]